MPVYCAGDGGEGSGAGEEVGFHGGEGVHGGSFDDVENDEAEEGRRGVGGCEVGDDGAA